MTTNTKTKHCMTCKTTKEKELSINSRNPNKNGKVYLVYICRSCRRDRYHKRQQCRPYHRNSENIDIATYYQTPKQDDIKFAEILKNADTINQNIMRKYAIPAGSRYRHMV
jgi:hypothetical protein